MSSSSGPSERPGTRLSFEELVGELRELGGRVVGVDMRPLAETEVVLASMEGEFNGFESDARSCSFLVGREDAPPRVRCWTGLEFERRWVTAARRCKGIAAVQLEVETGFGLLVSIWPAMPPHHQWTEMHDEVR